MTHYFNVCDINGADVATVDVFNRNVDGRYTLAKLMERSWWGNEMVDTICKKLYKNPHKVAWVGDYADDADPVNGMRREERGVCRRCLN